MTKSVRTQLHICVLEACPSDGEESFFDTGVFYFFNCFKDCRISGRSTVNELIKPVTEAICLSMQPHLGRVLCCPLTAIMI